MHARSQPARTLSRLTQLALSSILLHPQMQFKLEILQLKLPFPVLKWSSPASRKSLALSSAAAAVTITLDTELH
jgi:hypothetical protein